MAAAEREAGDPRGGDNARRRRESKGMGGVVEVALSTARADARRPRQRIDPQALRCEKLDNETIIDAAKSGVSPIARHVEQCLMPAFGVEAGHQEPPHAKLAHVAERHRRAVGLRLYQCAKRPASQHLVPCLYQSIYFAICNSRDNAYG